MNLAPVVDVNNNPANPVIGVRSFGEDARLVARLGAAIVRGYHAAGIISCLKHFPGHGDTATDSHLALPAIPHSLERLRALELVPFGRGIEAGADSVMIAHITFPALEKQSGLAATLSPAIIQGLLRDQLGFDGLVLSDCLEMLAIADTYGTEHAAVMALQAGIDLAAIDAARILTLCRPRDRIILEQRMVGLTTEEMAGKQVVSPAAVRIRLLRARRYSGRCRASSNSPACDRSSGQPSSCWKRPACTSRAGRSAGSMRSRCSWRSRRGRARLP